MRARRPAGAGRPELNGYFQWSLWKTAVAISKKLIAAAFLRESCAMAVWMAGVDHTKADLDVRSVFAFTNKRIEQAYIDLKDTPGLEGCILMSTCNRMEIWFSVSSRADFSPATMVRVAVRGASSGFSSALTISVW